MKRWTQITERNEAMIPTVICVHLFTVTVHTVQTVLKMQLLISTIFMTGLLVPFVLWVLPPEFKFYGKDVMVSTITTTCW
jgi:hypothetical protein